MTSPYLTYSQLAEKKQSQRLFTHFNALDQLDQRALQKGVLNMSSFDPLHLSTNDYMVEKAIDYALMYGSGSTTYRLLPQHLEHTQRIEKQLAEVMGKDLCKIVNVDIPIHESLLQALHHNKVHWLVDHLCPNQWKTAFQKHQIPYEIVNVDDVETMHLILGDTPAKQTPWLVISSIYRHNFKDIYQKIQNYKRSFPMLIMLDETHAFGMQGYEGLGWSANKTLWDMTLGSFPKSTGILSYYLGMQSPMHDYLSHEFPFNQISNPFPFTLGVIEGMLSLMLDMHVERAGIKSEAKQLAEHLNRRGWTAYANENQVTLDLAVDDIVAGFAKHAADHNLLYQKPFAMTKTHKVALSITRSFKTQEIDECVERLASFSVDKRVNII